jgi:hypothetical protein
LGCRRHAFRPPLGDADDHESDHDDRSQDDEVRGSTGAVLRSDQIGPLIARSRPPFACEQLCTPAVASQADGCLGAGAHATSRRRVAIQPALETAAA